MILENIESINSIRYFKTYSTNNDIINYDPIYTSVEIYYDGNKWIKKTIHKNINISYNERKFRYNNPAVVIEEVIDNQDLIFDEIKNITQGNSIEYYKKDYLFAPYLGKWELDINDEKIISASNRISYEGIENIKELLKFKEQEKKVMHIVLDSIEDESEKILYALTTNIFDLELSNMLFKEKYELVKSYINQKELKK